MEAHTHTHSHGKKNWKEYFWEFLMLFLAVTLGFFVENQRETVLEHHREKQFMISMVEDLYEDITILNKQINDGSIEIAQMDSLIFMLSDKNSMNQGARLYYLGRTASRHDIFNYNDRTIDQMRNSGGFRLVRKKNVANLIMGYYRQIKLLEMVEGIEKNETQDYRRAAIKVFDPIIFNSIVNASDSILAPTGNPSLRTRDPETLKDLAGWVQYMRSSVTGFRNFKSILRKMGEDLIAQIKKEYHI